MLVLGDRSSSDDGVPGEKVGRSHPLEDFEGEVEVEGQGVEEEAAGDEGAAEETGGDGEGEDGTEAAKREAILEAEQARVPLDKAVIGDPRREWAVAGECGRRSGAEEGEEFVWWSELVQGCEHGNTSPTHYLIAAGCTV